MDKDRDKGDDTSAKCGSNREMGRADPESRLKSLSNYGTVVEIDYNTPARRYSFFFQRCLRMVHLFFVVVIDQYFLQILQVWRGNDQNG